MYRENIINGFHLRVLTVPLQVGVHRIAVLQVATSLTVVDSARTNLINILLTSAADLGRPGGARFMAGAWDARWRRWESITETAQAINRADDLSRRIPYKGPANDEIGRLIESFNQTLERLENLFTSQQQVPGRREP